MAEIIRDERLRGSMSSGGGSGDGGDDGGMGTLTVRVDRLERDVGEIRLSTSRTEIAVTRIEERLEHLATAVGVEALKTEVARVSAKMDAKADATAVSHLQGVVSSLPSLAQLAALGSLLALALAGAGWAIHNFAWLQ